MSKEGKLEGGLERGAISLSREGRHGKGSFAAPLSLLLTYPPSGGEGFLAERKGVDEEKGRL